jgi:hypothetical protein
MQVRLIFKLACITVRAVLITRPYRLLCTHGVRCCVDGAR